MASESDKIDFLQFLSLEAREMEKDDEEEEFNEEEGMWPIKFICIAHLPYYLESGFIDNDVDDVPSTEHLRRMPISASTREEVDRELREIRERYRAREEVFIGSERDVLPGVANTSISADRLDREIQMRQRRRDGVDRGEEHQLFMVRVKVS